MKRTILLVVLFGLFFSACSSESEQTVEKPIPVKIYKVKPESISKFIKLTGAVTASNDAVVFSKITEKLVKINVNPGDNVSAGQVLAVQYNTSLEQGVKLAEAALKSAEATLKLVNQESERVTKLFQQKAASQQQYDQAVSQKETAEAAFEQAKLQIAQERERYDNSFIKAPFAGVVAAFYYENNQMVPAGTAVAQVVGKNGIKAKLKVSSKDIPLIKSGQPVKVSFPSIPDQTYNGSVVNINQAVDPVTRLLEIEVQITNPDSRVKSGIFGEFLIDVVSKENTMVIPETASLQQTEIIINKETGMQQTVKKYYVFLVKNNKAELKEIKAGIINDGRMEILNGLQISDNVVVVGQNIVREGQTVNVIE